MPADEYSSIFLHQMEAIVDILVDYGSICRPFLDQYPIDT